MIEVEGLTKRYSDRVAVDHISFRVEKGEVLGFLGQNGAGKTTTMKMITGFMAATEGLVRVAGYDVFEHPMEVKRRIGYLPETPPLYLELLIEEYLSFVADVRQVPKNKKQARIQDVLEQCQLTDVRKRLIGNLSKGYRQRVGLAQALVHDPEVVILDEPTIGLDPKQVTEARQLIRNMRGQKTLVYSSHILSEVAATCDRIIIIDKGKIVAQESLGTSAVGHATTELVVRKVSESILQSVRNIKGVHKVESFVNGSQRIVIESEPKDELLAEIASVVVSQGSGLLRMSPLQLGLEEYYLKLIGARRA